MSSFLDPNEAYAAGLNDHALALRRARSSVKRQRIPAHDEEERYLAELGILWRERIERGDLPLPLIPNLAELPKAS